MGRACEQASCLLLLRGRRHVTVQGLMHEQTMRGLMHEQTQAGLACTQGWHHTVVWQMRHSIIHCEPYCVYHTR